MKLQFKMNVMKNIFVLFAATLFISCKTIDKEKFVLPLNYEGPVIVIFNQKDGKAKKYDDEGYRVYEIENNGVLKTQFKTQEGEIEQKFVYKNSDGSLQALKDIRYDSGEDIYQDSEVPNKLPINEIFTANWGSQLFNSVYSIDFLVGKSKDSINTLFHHSLFTIDSLYNSALTK